MDENLAFAPLVDRAKAAQASTADRISLRDHVVMVDIGAFQQERGHRQRVRFNVVVEVASPETVIADDVDRILSYDRITDAISAELAAERVNLLETLAERVAERVLREPAARRVFVQIEKLDVGPYALGVEIVRDRLDAVPADLADMPHPVIIHLDQAAINAPELGVRIDGWARLERPVVLTVGLLLQPRPQTGHGPTQRRIDLLAMEQAAWVLAARDARCVVVETRTELDWAMRQRRMVVWAPSKLVLDAVDGPASIDPVDLSHWLGQVLGADRVVFHGDVTVSQETAFLVIRP